MVEGAVDFGSVFRVAFGVGLFVVRDLAPNMARNCGYDFCSTLITPFLGFAASGRDISREFEEDSVSDE